MNGFLRLVSSGANTRKLLGLISYVLHAPVGLKRYTLRKNKQNKHIHSLNIDLFFQIGLDLRRKCSRAKVFTIENLNIVLSSLLTLGKVRFR